MGFLEAHPFRPAAKKKYCRDCPTFGIFIHNKTFRHVVPAGQMPLWFILVEGQQAFDDKNVEEVRQGKFSYAVFAAWIACTAEFFFIFQHAVSCRSSDFLLPRHGRLGTRGLPHISTTECSRYGNVTSFTPMNDPATRYALLQSISTQAACVGKCRIRLRKARP